MSCNMLPPICLEYEFDRDSTVKSSNTEGEVLPKKEKDCFIFSNQDKKAFQEYYVMLIQW